MPFAKRSVEPQRLCRRAHADGLALQDLGAFSHAALSRTLRQLSDLAGHACSLFQELELELLSTSRRVCALREKMRALQTRSDALDPKQEAVPLSNLDVESKLSGHYQAPWHLTRNVFLPSTRPSCVDQLHHHATQSLPALYRDQQQRQEVSERERRITVSIIMAPPMPTYPPHRARRARPLTTAVSPADSDSEGLPLGTWPKSPIPNVPSTLDKHTNWAGILPLPTPEEKMKSDSQVITSCIVPINVTGVGFDREASVRCSLVHSQSVLQRRRKLKRRKTITGIPRRVQQDLDSDESPGARERTVIVHANPEECQEDLELTRLTTKDSGCQTEEFLVAGAAPSRRRIRAQRGQNATLTLSHSTGNISSLPDSSDSMFRATVGARLRSRSLPREGGRLVDEGNDDSDEDEEELSPFEAEDFLTVQAERILKDDEESTDDQAIIEGQRGTSKFKHAVSSDHEWMERGHSCLPQKTEMGSCEISSSSDTFSSPIHSVSNAGVLTSQMDHKEDHQSSSGNWSGSSSTCPSQTSETIPPAASPQLTGSSHCDSELSLNAATNTNDDSTGFNIDPYPGDRLHDLHSHRTGSFISTDLLDDAGVSTASDGDWNYSQYRHSIPCQPDFSPEHSRAENSLGCPSFASIATFESLTDRPPSEKADTSSHFSVDAEGYYTSMHFDCGLKGSKSFTYNYASVDQQLVEFGHQNSIMGRHSLSLRRPKMKPSPPKRSSSLKKLSSHVGPPSNTTEPKNAGGKNKSKSSADRTSLIGLNGGSSSRFESQEPLEAWCVERATEIPDVASFCSAETHSFKDEGAVQSDYADLWLLNDLKSNDTYRSLSNSSTATGTTVIECIKSQESSESQTSQSGSRATTPSLPSVESEFRLPSPEKLVGLASPSSGYSSQSETPTSSHPSAFFPNPHPMSPSNAKRKPKVPERKSSLASLQHHSSKKDLELPSIPPIHLNLSALSKASKPSLHKNQLRVLHHKKEKAAVEEETKAEDQAMVMSNDDSLETSPLAITPMVLHSVQLRSVGESADGSCETATRPKCPTVTIITPPTHNKTHESRKPPPYRPLQMESSQDESFLIPIEDHCSKNAASQLGTKNRYDRLAPSVHWSVTASLSEEVNVDVVKSVNWVTSADMQSNLEADENQLLRIDSNGEGMSLPKNLPGQDGLAKSESLEQVPDIVSKTSEKLQSCTVSGAVDHSEDFESSGVPAQSASQEHLEECSTPDTEDYFSKESTPSDQIVSPVMDDSRSEDDGVFLSPSRSRTTEDLFAMIHRSKRKMLGRKDSGEAPARSRASVSGNGHSTNPSPSPSPSSPNTPTTPTSLTASQKTPGPIYRSAKKSITSNEEFKLLLLRKGSRSDSSYRMSATEILKSPIAPKSPGEFLFEASRSAEEQSFLPQHSPEATTEQVLSPFPKTCAETFSTKSFPTSAASRQGRSRMPPAANSSRYSTRSRLYTAPMQAISEGETENSDGSPHDDRSS